MYLIYNSAVLTHNIIIVDYKLLLKNDVNAALKATFKQYRETHRSSIKEAKRLYYYRTFLLYQNNVRKTWSVIK